MNKINYYLVIDKIAYKLYVLIVIREKDMFPFHTAYFTKLMEEEIYSQLFTLIKDRNNKYNEVANIHIPNNWDDHEYEELLNVFNANYLDLRLSRDRINLIASND